MGLFSDFLKEQSDYQKKLYGDCKEKNMLDFQPYLGSPIGKDPYQNLDKQMKDRKKK